MTGSKDFERRRSAAPYWDDKQDDDLAMMHGDMQHASCKRDSGESAGGGELSMHDGACRGIYIIMCVCVCVRVCVCVFVCARA